MSEEPIEQIESAPPETSTAEMMKLEVDAEPEVRLAMLEKTAELAPRFADAINTILAAMTYPQDWVEFSGMMCLKSAAAERVAKMFPYKVEDGVTQRREDWTDSVGKGYRIIYEGYVSCEGRRIWAMGCYSNREAFLAKKGGDWKADEEINENNIRRAAYHFFIGNALKSLLGLRAIPKDIWQKVMDKTGRPDATTGKVPFKTGSRGGASAEDKTKQADLCKACLEIVNAGYVVEYYQKKWKLAQMSDEDSICEQMAVAERVCIDLSSFEGKDGKVSGKPASKLSGKRLTITLKTAQELAAKAVQG